MTAGPIPITKPTATLRKAPLPPTPGRRVKRAVELRAGRLRVFLLVLALLLPLLLTALFGGG